MKEFMSTLYSFDYNTNEEDERVELSSDEEINLLINESLEEIQIDSEGVIQTRKRSKAPLISESSWENQNDSEVVNLKRKKKTLLINETPKLENDSYIHWQNIWHKGKKYSKIGQDLKNVISKFACFLTANVNV